MKDRAPLRAALGHQNVRAFLAVIDLGEHGPNAESLDRYRTIYGGEKFDAPPWEHPRRKVKAGEWTSSAAGRGQFLAATWDGLLKQYGFPDFSPACQDEAMVALIIGRGALEDVLAGRLEAALAKCSKEWASLPGSPYGQPTITLDDARWRYLARGGQLSGTPGFNPDTLATEHYGEAVTESTIQPIPSADQQEARFMDPLTALSLISTVGPYIVNLIPQVKKLFDPAVPVAERNVGAAVAVLQTISDVAKTPDVHAAIANMKTDPQLRQDVTNAVLTHPEVVGLLEIGGGIVGARKANAEAATFPLTRDRAFIFGLLFVAIVVMMLVDFLFVHPGNYDGNLRTQIVTAILALAAIVGAYFFGTSQGSQRKTDILANQEK